METKPPDIKYYNLLGEHLVTSLRAHLTQMDYNAGSNRFRAYIFCSLLKQAVPIRKRILDVFHWRRQLHYRGFSQLFVLDLPDDILDQMPEECAEVFEIVLEVSQPPYMPETSLQPFEGFSLN